MKRTGPVSVFLFALVLFCGCGHQTQNDAAAIREGINAHLAAVTSINMSAMDMSITNVTVQDDKAQAQVNFVPKGAAPGVIGMQVAYSLEKQNGKWSVINTQPTGGMGQHPDPGQVPSGPGNASPTGAPDFSNLLHGQPSNSLPSGHPEVNSQGSSVAPLPGGSPH